MGDIDERESFLKQQSRIIGSGLASFFAKFATHPIDTVKAKLQINRLHMKNISDVQMGGALRVAKDTYKNEGVKGFYRGASISAIGSALAFSFYLQTYERCKKRLKDNDYFKDNEYLIFMVSGFAAQIASCSLWLPIDIIKQRMQVQSSVKIYEYHGPRDAMTKIRKSEGLPGLYRAFGATLLQFGPFSAIFFPIFQAMKQKVCKDPKTPQVPENIISSIVASGIAGFITTPLQIVKLRMQIQRADVAVHGGSLEKSLFGYRNALHGLVELYNSEGFFSLFKGGMLRVSYTIPITSITMTLAQYFKQRILEKGILQNFI